MVRRRALQQAEDVAHEPRRGAVEAAAQAGARDVDAGEAGGEQLGLLLCLDLFEFVLHQLVCWSPCLCVDMLALCSGCL